MHKRELHSYVKSNYSAQLNLIKLLNGHMLIDDFKELKALGITSIIVF